MLEESNRTPSSSNREHSWLKISVLAPQSAVSGLRWTFGKLHELHTFVIFAELKIFHFYCVVFLTAAETKDDCVKSHDIEEISASGVLEPICSASHSSSSSFSVKLVALCGRFPIPDWRSSRAFSSKTCLEEWNSRSYASINVKPEGGGPPGICGAFDFSEEFLVKIPTMGPQNLVKSDQISPSVRSIYIENE